MFVYFIQDKSLKDTYKIGLTTGSIKTRLVAIDTVNTYELKLIACRPCVSEWEMRGLESALHKKYKAFNTSFTDRPTLTEWFKLPLSKVQEIIDILQADSLNLELVTATNRPLILADPEKAKSILLQPQINSRQIAECFGKSHKNVLRDFDKAINKLQPLPAGYSAEVITIIEPYAKIARRELLVSKSLFNIAALGYTGEAAFQYKLWVIAKLNLLESKESKSDL